MKLWFAAFMPLALGACAPLEPLPIAVAPLEASNPIFPAPAGPAPVYGVYGVVEPSDWRGVNEAQSGNGA